MTLGPLKFGDKIVYDVGAVASNRMKVAMLVERAVKGGATADAQALSDTAAILACVVREMGGKVT
jgi:hypothetical protein